MTNLAELNTVEAAAAHIASMPAYDREAARTRLAAIVAHRGTDGAIGRVADAILSRVDELRPPSPAEAFIAEALTHGVPRD